MSVVISSSERAPCFRSNMHSQPRHSLLVLLRDDLLVERSLLGTTIDVRLVGTTQYLKWITQKPLQRDTRADRSLIEVGKLVAVEAFTPSKRRAGETPLEARVVQIAID